MRPSTAAQATMCLRSPANNLSRSWWRKQGVFFGAHVRPFECFYCHCLVQRKLLTEGGHLQICLLETLMCNFLHHCVYLFQEVLFFRPCLFCDVHHALFGGKSHLLKNTPTRLFTHLTLCYYFVIVIFCLTFDYLRQKSMLRGRNTLKLSVLPDHFKTLQCQLIALAPQ